MNWKDYLPLVLSLAVNIMFFTVLVSLLFRELPGTSKDVLLILLGALVAGWKDVLGYWIGSSAGSAKKSDVISQALEQKTTEEVKR